MRTERGNISLIFLSAAVVVLMVLMLLFDLCRVFAARERTKNASDAVVLAVAQDLIYFNQQERWALAEEVVCFYGCSLVSLSVGYDGVEAEVKREVNLVLVDRIIPGTGTVYSKSRSEVVYPWDIRFNYCDYYKFDYRED